MISKQDEQERFELYMKMKRKRIRQSSIASALNVSEAWISYFFSNKVNISDTHYKRLVEYIEAR